MNTPAMVEHLTGISSTLFECWGLQLFRSDISGWKTLPYGSVFHLLFE